jgi:SAM-dependent methyltransferase
MPGYIYDERGAIDNSRAMLDRAIEKAKELENAQFVVGDMRSFELGEKFGFIFIAAGTFQMLLETEDQIACLQRVRDHLAPGGRFAFNIGNPDVFDMVQWLRERRGTFARRPQRDYRDPETGNEVRSWGSIEYHPSTQRSVSYGFTETLDANGNVIAKRYGQPMELRYFYRYEVEHLLARCGLAVEALHGDFARTRYSATSGQLLWVASAAQ